MLALYGGCGLFCVLPVEDAGSQDPAMITLLTGSSPADLGRPPAGSQLLNRLFVLPCRVVPNLLRLYETCGQHFCADRVALAEARTKLLLALLPSNPAAAPTTATACRCKTGPSLARADDKMAVTHLNQSGALPQTPPQWNPAGASSTSWEY